MKTSINIQPCKIATSEVHNTRACKLDYVRPEFTRYNESYSTINVEDCFAEIRYTYEKNVGQKMQKKATPIREGVVVISEDTTMKDLKELGEAYERAFGIKTIQIHMHQDEGHFDLITNNWKPNFHAHMVFNWTKKDGRAVRLNKQDMALMQSITAEVLGMERGESSDIKHLNAVQFKNKKMDEAAQSLSLELQKLEELKNKGVEEKPKKSVLSSFLPSTVKDYQKEIKELQNEKKRLIRGIEEAEEQYCNSLRVLDLKNQDQRDLKNQIAELIEKNNQLEAQGLTIRDENWKLSARIAALKKSKEQAQTQIQEIPKVEQDKKKNRGMSM